MTWRASTGCCLVSGVPTRWRLGRSTTATTRRSWASRSSSWSGAMATSCATTGLIHGGATTRSSGRRRGGSSPRWPRSIWSSRRGSISPISVDPRVSWLARSRGGGPAGRRLERGPCRTWTAWPNVSPRGCRRHRVPRSCTTTTSSTTRCSVIVVSSSPCSTGTWPRSAIRSSISARCSPTGPTRRVRHMRSSESMPSRRRRISDRGARVDPAARSTSLAGRSRRDSPTRASRSRRAPAGA